jgi:hypothetical protein
MIEIKNSKYSHPDITSGVHTNGLSNTFIRQNGGQWFIVTTRMPEVGVRANVHRLGFERFVKVHCQPVVNMREITVINAIPVIFEHQDTGPIFGVQLPQSLPLPSGMKQAVPRNDELQRVRERVGDRTVGALEVALAIVEAVNVTGLALASCSGCKRLVVNLPNCPVAYCLKCAVDEFEEANAKVLAAGQI